MEPEVQIQEMRKGLPCYGTHGALSNLSKDGITQFRKECRRNADGAVYWGESEKRLLRDETHSQLKIRLPATTQTVESAVNGTLSASMISLKIMGT